MRIEELLNEGKKFHIEHGDCLQFLKKLPDQSVDLVITSPPYNLGQEYEKRVSFESYLQFQERVIKECVRILKDNGSICWQVGNYKEKQENFPLDIFLYSIFKKFNLTLRNRIIWHFRAGLGSNRKFYKKYETILWFTKSDNYTFNLDPVRIPRRYPQKKFKHGKNIGKCKGSALGKNPGDVWLIPLVNNIHPEKTAHPCQFPIGLIERLILSLSNKGDIVLDPFIGSGTTAVASLLHNRRCIAIEKERKYIDIIHQRIHESQKKGFKYKSYLNPKLFKFFTKFESSFSQ